MNFPLLVLWYKKCVLNFQKADNVTGYYIVLKHRNSVETWSQTGNSFTVNFMNYNFTSAQTNAYGNNLVFKGTKYCVYSGDVDYDGVIDGSDMSNVENSVANSETGYINSDVNGDSFADAGDLSIVENNSFASVKTIRP